MYVRRRKTVRQTILPIVFKKLSTNGDYNYGDILKGKKFQTNMLLSTCQEKGIYFHEVDNGKVLIY